MTAPVGTAACSCPFPNSCPAGTCDGPPAPQVWVKRWVWKWQSVSATTDPDLVCAGDTCNYMRVAACTFKQGRYILPAICDWPRWRLTACNALPPDEYFQVTYEEQWRCPDPLVDQCSCGLLKFWIPMIQKIETPRDVRWVHDMCETGCGDIPIQSQ